MCTSAYQLINPGSSTYNQLDPPHPVACWFWQTRPNLDPAQIPNGVQQKWSHSDVNTPFFSFTWFAVVWVNILSAITALSNQWRSESIIGGYSSLTKFSGWVSCLNFLLYLFIRIHTFYKWFPTNECMLLDRYQLDPPVVVVCLIDRLYPTQIPNDM